MTTIYLHIGAPKTATSSLQAVLASEHEHLLAQGILYPNELRHGDAHHLLACDLIDRYHANPMPDFWYGDRPRGEAWSSLLCEISQCETPPRAVILSTELFFGQTSHLEKMLADIRDYLKDYRVKIVAYLRRQDGLYSSFYNQDVKGVRQWSESAYAFYEQHQLFVYDYHELLHRWGAVFGTDNILIRPFEPQQWPQQDILQDFCQLLDIELPDKTIPRSNDGIGPSQLCIKHSLNRIGFDKTDNDKVIEYITSLCPETVVSNLSYVKRGYYRKRRQEWLKVNKLLEDDFCNGKPLFLKPIPPPQDIVLYAADPQRLRAYIKALPTALTEGHLGRLATLFARAAFLLIAEHHLWDQLNVADRDTLNQYAWPAGTAY